jgi:dTDP-glucose 4,6-dehydratase
VISLTASESRIVFEALPANDPKQRRPDITRAQQLLGWAPRIGLEDGLRMLLERSRRAELLGRTVGA